MCVHVVCIASVIWHPSLQSCPGLSYAPGDALACLCPNPAPEVDYVLARLGLGGGADTPLHLSILPTTVKKSKCRHGIALTRPWRDDVTPSAWFL